MIYLDNAATTQILPEVLDAMMPYLKNEYGNAGTIYGLGRSAASVVEKARVKVAKFIGASAVDIVFTSGGTEGNNLVFRGVKDYLASIGKKHVVISTVEHDSVFKSATEIFRPEKECDDKSLIKDEFGIAYLGVDSRGTVDTDRLCELLLQDDEIGLVSVMYVNNETGAVNPISKIGSLCKAKGILFHTDCVQAAGSHPIDVNTIQCDFLTLSSHKIHGPKGVGALYIRDKKIMKPLIYGGAYQEFGVRGGTENVAGVVGFGKACAIAHSEFGANRTSVSLLKRLFYQNLIAELTPAGLDSIVSVNGAPVGEYGKILNLRIENVDGETLLLMLDASGVCVSAGSACRSHESEPSRVLTAMGLSPDEARDSIRVSFSTTNTTDEVQEAAHIFATGIISLSQSMI